MGQADGESSFFPLFPLSLHLVSEAIYLADPEGNGIEIYRDRPRAEWKINEGRMVRDIAPFDIGEGQRRPERIGLHSFALSLPDEGLANLEDRAKKAGFEAVRQEGLLLLQDP